MDSVNDFTRWLSGNRPKMVRMAAAIVRDRSAAEDIVQDTLIKVWDAHRKDKVRELSAYASRAVWINALKYRARRKHWLPLDHEMLVDICAPEAVEPGLSPGELEEALSGLPPVQQSILRLRYYSGLSFREIGMKLGISINTAASRSRYALEKLRETFREK